MFDLSSITTARVNEPPRIVIFASGGIGKTTFGASAPSPIVVMTEKGQGKLNFPHFPMITSWNDGLQALDTLITQEHQFKTLCWDSLDWWEPHIWAETCRTMGVNNIEDPGYGKGYTVAAGYWSTFLKGLTLLQETKGMMIVLTAHAEVKRFDSPESDPYDRYQIKLHKRAAELVYEWADIVLFANYKSSVVKTDVGFKKKVARGIGTGSRVIYTEERPAFKAKNRYGLPPEIAFTLPFDWQWFMSQINGEPTPQPVNIEDEEEGE